STPQAKTYRANEKAIATGDIEGYKKTMSAESLKMMDSQSKEMKKSPKEILDFIKMMAPTGVKLTDLKVDGKKATLSMTGKSDGQVMNGSADIAEEGGQGKMKRPSRWNAQQRK